MAVSRRLVSSHFPYLPIRVQVGQHTIDTEALLDTGFDGAVVLPVSLLEGLLANGVPPLRYMHLTLADGSTLLAPRYTGTLRIGQLEPFRVDVVVLGDEPIVGLTATNRYYVGLDHGRQIIIEP